MKKKFAPYDISLTLKQKGFNEPCFGTYGFNGEFSNELFLIDDIRNMFGEQLDAKDIRNGINGDDVTAPLWDDVIEWLEEKHKIFFSTNVDQTMEPKFCYSISQYTEPSQHEAIWITHVFNSDLFYTRKEARYEGIKHALTLI